jgi:hypothetical protein
VFIDQELKKLESAAGTIYPQHYSSKVQRGWRSWTQ